MLDTKKMATANNKLQFINLDNFVANNVEQVVSIIKQDLPLDIKYVQMNMLHDFSSQKYQVFFSTNISSVQQPLLSISMSYMLSKVQRDRINNDASTIIKLAKTILRNFKKSLQQEISYQDRRKLDTNFLEIQCRSQKLLFSNYDYALWAIANLNDNKISNNLSFSLLDNADGYFVKLLLSNFNELLQLPNAINIIINFLLYPSFYQQENKNVLFHILVKTINQPKFNFNSFNTFAMFELAIRHNNVILPLCIVSQNLKEYKQLHHLLDDTMSSRSDLIQITFNLVDENDLKALLGFVLANRSTVVVKKITNLPGIKISLNGQRKLVIKYLNMIKAQQQDWNNTSGFNCVINALEQLLDYDSKMNQD